LFETTLGHNKYGAYCVPNSSLKTSPPAKKIISGEVYEPDTIDFIINNCKNGDVIHAGTYFGDFLPAIANNIAAGAKIWAFEPKKEHYFCAVETLKLNKIDNTSLMNVGLGAEQGTQILQTTTDDGRVWGGGSRIVSENKPNDCTEEISVVTIDGIIPDNRMVSILHLDVEGFETSALVGAKETIKRCLPILILETMPTASWIKNNLSPLGYSVKRTVHQNTILTVGR